MSPWRQTLRLKRACPRPQALAALVVVAALAVGLSPTAGSYPEDIRGHWAREEIEDWLDRGWISGYPDGTFRPDEQVSRAEFVAFLTRAYQVPTTEEEPGFVDVDRGDWYFTHVSNAYAAGLLSGYPGGFFRPQSSITREETAVIVNRVLQLPDPIGTPPYEDHWEISDWAVDDVAAITAGGIIEGYHDNTFRPQEAITRAETVTILASGQGGEALQQEVASYDLSVVVVDPEGDPRAGATVQLQRNAQAETVETDAQGRAVIEDLPPGTYDCLVQCESETEAKEQVDLREDKTKRIEL